MADSHYFCHESSYVDEGALVGEGSKIWHFSHIMSDCEIGSDCNIGQNVCVSSGVKIGDNVKIQNNISLYTGIVVEDDVFLGPSCVFTNVSNPRSQVSRKKYYEKTVIKRGATLGANSTIVCGVELGYYSFIAAGAVVTQTVPAYALVVGVPGKIKGWMSRHGHILSEEDNSGIMVCPESGLRYKFDDNGILKCIDLAEDDPLPEYLSTGKDYYKNFKK
ncbi:acyltransferase [Sedimentisphaera salicampi]|uniref:acyltransferase n=1 Tax=Sedimentisphaera salicampi TaxID=1941349 RepID=UPI000B9C2F87|nr:acyltransferase [Sedimentisphaera salicampi]OXU15564.1 UDP-2-acetamido-3-amino-2,3-dideoxy-D-glucuronate N-acetyltransferase [Sedimentisphaera salicampi]